MTTNLTLEEWKQVFYQLLPSPRTSITYRYEKGEVKRTLTIGASITNPFQHKIATALHEPLLYFGPVKSEQEKLLTLIQLFRSLSTGSPSRLYAGAGILIFLTLLYIDEEILDDPRLKLPPRINANEDESLKTLISKNLPKLMPLIIGWIEILEDKEHELYPARTIDYQITLNLVPTTTKASN